MFPNKNIFYVIISSLESTLYQYHLYKTLIQSNSVIITIGLRDFLLQNLAINIFNIFDT